MVRKKNVIGAVERPQQYIGVIDENDLPAAGIDDRGIPALTHTLGDLLCDVQDARQYCNKAALHPNDYEPSSDGYKKLCLNLLYTARFVTDRLEKLWSFDSKVWGLMRAQCKQPIRIGKWFPSAHAAAKDVVEEHHRTWKRCQLSRFTSLPEHKLDEEHPRVMQFVTQIHNAPEVDYGYLLVRMGQERDVAWFAGVDPHMPVTLALDQLEEEILQLLEEKQEKQQHLGTKELAKGVGESVNTKLKQTLALMAVHGWIRSHQVYGYGLPNWRPPTTE